MYCKVRLDSSCVQAAKEVMHGKTPEGLAHEARMFITATCQTMFLIIGNLQHWMIRKAEHRKVSPQRLECQYCKVRLDSSCVQSCKRGHCCAGGYVHNAPITLQAPTCLQVLESASVDGLEQQAGSRQQVESFKSHVYTSKSRFPEPQLQKTWLSRLDVDSC